LEIEKRLAELHLKIGCERTIAESEGRVTTAAALERAEWHIAGAIAEAAAMVAQYP
jgi:hypothetical protein